jgi:NAD(P)H-dependent FMN reductase
MRGTVKNDGDILFLNSCPEPGTANAPQSRKVLVKQAARVYNLLSINFLSSSEMKMKVLAIQGSPRKDGNPAAILGLVGEELSKLGHEFEFIELSDFKVNGCRGCYCCQDVKNGFQCFQKDDDANELYGRMEKADAIIFAAPVYCWSFPTDIKALMERGMCVVRGYGSKKHVSILGGKRAGLLLTAGGPEKDNADLIPPVFEKFANWIKVKVKDELVIPFCDSPDKLPKGAGEKAAKFAKTLTAK